MRPAIAALVIAGVALLAGLLPQQPERAAADYNISGQWFLQLDGGLAVCEAIVTETYDSPPAYALSITVGCAPAIPFGKMAGTIDANTGSFSVIRVDSNPLTGGTFSMSGTVSPDTHSMSGTWTAHSHVTPGLEGTFTGTGGDGAPKPGTATPSYTPTASATPMATPTPTATWTATATATPTRTPRPVGGVAFDTPSGGTFEAWWLIAIAGTAFAALGCVIVYARRAKASA